MESAGILKSLSGHDAFERDERPVSPREAASGHFQATSC
jgi:hypothetical protein